MGHTMIQDATAPFAPDLLSVERERRLHAVAAQLGDCLGELDRLGLWIAGAQVSQALDAVLADAAPGTAH